MPTPYGSRGGVAFSADELRVLGGALAIALQSDPAPEEAREYLRLAEAVDETVREGYRLRSFLLGDLARYREALPGAAAGYLEQLEAALTTGYLPRPDDLAALRTLVEEAAGEHESARRLALLRRCENLAERAVRARLRIVPGGRLPQDAAPPVPVAAERPEPAEPGPEPAARPAPEPRADPAPRPARPVPTPAEVFPPRRATPGDEPPAGPEQAAAEAAGQAEARDPVPA